MHKITLKSFIRFKGEAFLSLLHVWKKTVLVMKPTWLRCTNTFFEHGVRRGSKNLTWSKWMCRYVSVVRIRCSTCTWCSFSVVVGVSSVQGRIDLTTPSPDHRRRIIQWYSLHGWPESVTWHHLYKTHVNRYSLHIMGLAISRAVAGCNRPWSIFAVRIRKVNWK